MDLTKGEPSAFASGFHSACFDDAAEAVAGEAVGVHLVPYSDLVRLGYGQEYMSVNAVHTTSTSNITHTVNMHVISIARDNKW